MKTPVETLMNKNYIGSWDLDNGNGGYKEIVVTIKEVRTDEVFSISHNAFAPVTVLVFTGDCKPLILSNKTNIKAMKQACGRYIEDWEGKRITLYVKTGIKAFGTVCDAIRIKEQAPPKPVLDPTHKHWDAIKQGLTEGKTTLADLLLKYSISQQDQKTLTNE